MLLSYSLTKTLLKLLNFVYDAKKRLLDCNMCDMTVS